ncbi:MAG TPA: histidine kinase dimerization/phospho-acceptor domain-containing protein, partial [Chitinophagaceae bacterium]|nr:histidine kinase dimerization/phospho-acceptor domain-containing protein [Chitinophagaceae bacterium]
MPVRLRITLLFTALVCVILGVVCFSIYYFSYTAFERTIRNRLKNRAITTARLLSRSEFFNRQLIAHIDSLTTLSLKQKAVKGYDHRNHTVYNYSDAGSDTLDVDRKILDEARVSGSVYFTAGGRKAVAYHYTDQNFRIVMVAAGTDEDGRRNLERLFQVLLLSFLGGLAMTFTVGYFFSGRLMRPVRQIADEVNELSAHNVDRRIATGSNRDEWNYLANTINKLLDRLQESFELQKRFIANASHELSTPLTAISSQLEVALQRERPANDYRKVMQSVHQDMQQLSKLTQTLLEFAKASGTAGGIEITPVRIDEVLLRLPSEIARLNAGFSVILHFGELPEEEGRLLVTGNE